MNKHYSIIKTMVWETREAQGVDVMVTPDFIGLPLKKRWSIATEIAGDADLKNASIYFIDNASHSMLWWCRISFKPKIVVAN